MSLTSDGIEVDLLIDSSAPQIPASARAVVANRSAIGEQYVDLQPDTDQGPFLEDGSVIAVGDTTTPIPIENVLTSANGLVHSLPVDALHTVAKRTRRGIQRQGRRSAGTCRLAVGDLPVGPRHPSPDPRTDPRQPDGAHDPVRSIVGDQAVQHRPRRTDGAIAHQRPRHPTRDRQRHTGQRTSRLSRHRSRPRAHDQPLQPLRRCSGSRTDTALAAALPALPACARRGGAHRCTGRRHSTSGLGTRDQQPRSRAPSVTKGPWRSSTR